MFKAQENKWTLTNIIIGITIIAYIIQTNAITYGGLFMGLNMYFLYESFYWQPLTTIFAHGGLGHLAMNMFVLYQFGNMIEAHMGVIRYLLLYLVGGLLTSIGSLGYMYFTGDWANLVGASGAISVLLGWFALRVPEQRKAIIIWVLLISFAPLLLGMPIGWYAHLIGFALGWLLGYIL